MLRFSLKFCTLLLAGTALVAAVAGCDRTDLIIEPAEPHIEFTYVPPYGSFDDLQGRVRHVRPADYRVAVYIRVGGGWWTKAYWDRPLTPIRADGTWTCDITTGGIDERATGITALTISSYFQQKSVTTT